MLFLAPPFCSAFSPPDGDVKKFTEDKAVPALCLLRWWVIFCNSTKHAHGQKFLAACTSSYLTSLVTFNLTWIATCMYKWRYLPKSRTNCNYIHFKNRQCLPVFKKGHKRLVFKQKQTFVSYMYLQCGYCN